VKESFRIVDPLVMQITLGSLWDSCDSSLTS